MAWKKLKYLNGYKEAWEKLEKYLKEEVHVTDDDIRAEMNDLKKLLLS